MYLVHCTMYVLFKMIDVLEVQENVTGTQEYEITASCKLDLLIEILFGVFVYFLARNHFDYKENLS